MLILQDQNWILRTKWNAYDIVLTIRVLLLRVVSEATIVPVIWDTIIVIIRITGISFTIFIMVSLVSIGDVRAVILVVLVAIFIYVLIVVTLVTNKVIICISLPQKIWESKFIIVAESTKVQIAWYLISQHFSSSTSLIQRDLTPWDMKMSNTDPPLQLYSKQGLIAVPGFFPLRLFWRYH